MSKMIARVTEEEGSVVGGLVELSNGDLTVTGRVATEDSNQFAVQWEDGRISLENKADYELVVSTKTAGPICQSPGCQGVANEYGVCPIHSVIPAATTTPAVADELMALPLAKGSVHTAEENPAQPAGWAVAPVDANAYPDGELIETEMAKREETAEWEDAQNRAPIDAENPAQPAGYAVPPASGQPIPGQGADALVTANVYAADATGENGLVELGNETIQITGRVIAANDDDFVVKWEDETNTVENKADYNLIIASLEEDEYLDFEDVEEVEDSVVDSEDFEDTEE